MVYLHIFHGHLFVAVVAFMFAVLVDLLSFFFLEGLSYVSLVVKPLLQVFDEAAKRLVLKLCVGLVAKVLDCFVVDVV